MLRIPAAGWLLPALLLCSCAGQAPDAETVIAEAIEAHGGSLFQRTAISFDFRGTHYVVSHGPQGHLFRRSWTDSAGEVQDRLEHGDFDRYIDGRKIAMTEQDSLSWSSTFTSVPYFAVLPFRLQDPAVDAKWLGMEDVNGIEYDKIEVTFEQEGGGRDWEDRFVYWFRRNGRTMDYLAYRFGDAPDDTRFREAKNIRTVGGIRFADYNNYVYESPGLDIAVYDSLFEAGVLERVSTVDLDNVSVSAL